MSEAILLSQVLCNNDIYHSLKIREENFLDTKNKLIFRAIGSLLKKGISADIHSVYEESKIDASYVSSLTNIYTDANYTFYENKILEEYKKRRIAKLSQEIKEKISLDSSELLNLIQTEISDISDNNNDRYKILGIHDLLCDYVEILDERIKRGGQLPGISTGYKRLDGEILGLEKQKFYIVAARPSDGKTAFIVNMICNIAKKNIPVGFLSLESGWVEISDRIIASESKVNSYNIRTGLISDSLNAKIHHACSNLYTSHIYMYDKPNISRDEVELQATRMVKQYDIKVLFLDYLQNITGKGDSKTDIVEKGCMLLNKLKKDLDIPVVAAAQINREGSEKPRMSNIKNSGQIEQDADTVLLLWKKNEDSFLTVSKNRDGKSGRTIELDFNKEYVRFEEK